MTPCRPNQIFFVASCTLGLKLIAYKVSSESKVVNLVKSVENQETTECMICGHQELIDKMRISI